MLYTSTSNKSLTRIARKTIQKGVRSSYVITGFYPSVTEKFCLSNHFTGCSAELKHLFYADNEPHVSKNPNFWVLILEAISFISKDLRTWEIKDIDDYLY